MYFRTKSHCICAVRRVIYFGDGLEAHFLFNCVYFYSFLMYINNFITLGNTFQFSVSGKPGWGDLCVQGVYLCIYV